MTLPVSRPAVDSTRVTGYLAPVTLSHGSLHNHIVNTF
nr:MAG TPA: hypothetical protein [Caudoviricetes sp.]